MEDYEPFRLSRTISVHSNDVRAVAFLGDSVITAGRDGTAKLSRPSGDVQTLVEGSQFLNSVATNDAEQAVFIGAHDGTITKVELASTQVLVYIGHTANVSCLDFQDPVLASGSWDHTVRVWSSPETSVTLEGHSQNVWDVKLLNDKQLLSASADRTIKLWDLESKSAVRTFVGHKDVVRSLVILSETHFASTSNDGSIIIWDLITGKPHAELSGHQSFVYSLAKLGENELVSSGEDRSVRIWNWTEGRALQTILLPSISQWCVAVSRANGDFVVGSSDNTARIFTRAASRRASETELKQFEDSVKASALGENEIDESQIADSSVLFQKGKQEGQVVMVRGASGQVEAHQYSGGAWTKIGDVVGSGQSTGSKKEKFNGEQYDYVFDVDIEDGAPPLKLPFNNTDNPYIVAEKFVLDNNLPSSYVQQVVQFLIQNSQAKSFDTTSTSTASTGVAASTSSTPAPSSTPDTSGQIPPVLLYSQLLFLKAFKKELLIKALVKSASERGESIEQLQIDSLLSSLPSSASELLQVALELKGRWSDNLDQLLPVFDLLRVAIADAGAVPQHAVWAQLLSALDPGVPKHALLATRGIVNLTARSDFNVTDAGTKTLLQQALAMLQDVAQAAPVGKPLAVALATLALNLAVHDVKGGDLARFLGAIGPKVRDSGDAEAQYRFALAVGLRTVQDPGEAAVYRKDWLTAPQDERRYTELLEVVLPRLKN